MTWFLGLDIGTTATKACAFDRSGTLQAESHREYPLDEPERGAAEQDPAAIRQAAEDCLAEVTRQMGTRPQGIGISTAMHTLLAIDEDGNPLTPSYTYADTRAHGAIRNWSAAKRSEIYQACGAPIHAMLPLAKIAWLKDCRPDVFAQTRRFVDLKAFLLYHWAGSWVTDYSTAAAYGFFAAEQRQWYPPALELLGITADQLPQLCAPPTTFAWRPERAEALGLAGVPLVAGSSDGCLANLGAGLLAPGPVALTIGTSGAVRMTLPRFTPDPEERLFSYYLADDLFVTGGASNNGGKILEWLRDTFFAAWRIPDIIDLALAVELGAAQLRFVPYLYGERAPVWDAEACGQLVGLRSYHRREHIARAALEGILYNLCISLERIDALGDPVTDIYANGGFTRSAGWVQLLADISGRRVHIARTPQASAYGAALMARQGTGAIGDWSELRGQRTIAQTFEPDPERHAIYQAHYQAFYSTVFPN
jgi:gluconokinase